MANVLQHHDLLIGTNQKNFLLRLDQLPPHKRRKELNSKSGDKPYPRFLYKFRPLIANNTELTNRLRDYLVESRLWLSSPAAFNDPFDMRGHFVFEGKLQDKRKHIDNRLKHFRPDLTKTQSELETSKLLAGGSFAKSIGNIFEQQRKTYGICSFAGDTRNILMWAHYGSDHTGVSLQFQLVQDFTIFSHAVSVDYSTEYPTINYLDGKFGKTIIPALLRKSKQWKYEQERRILHPDGANHYLQFKSSALTALILGCEIGVAEEKIIKMLLIERKQKGYPALKVFRAIRHKTEYRLCLQYLKNWVDSESAE